MTLSAKLRVTLDAFTLTAELDVADGELLVVVGPNGAGKTTLLRALSGLQPIDDGRIEIDGVVVDEPASSTFVPPNRRSVGLVFQHYLLFEHLSALDNVAFGLRERGMRRSAARERARALLERLGLGERAAARPAVLSGGEAQRVALARALAIEPGVLLLDEPMGALDVQTRVETRRHLRDTIAMFDGARVLVTHDPVDAFTLADRILILEDGGATHEGTRAEIVERPRSAYVAELVGLNLYRGRADGEKIDVNGTTLVAADAYHGDVVVTIAPNAVVVHAAPPSGSARNVWPGTIALIERSAQRVRLRIESTLNIVAEITPAALAALDLREGAAVWIAVKATEIEVQSA
jgi:molybdate transport system ATP-binding protein